MNCCFNRTAHVRPEPNPAQMSVAQSTTVSGPTANSLRKGASRWKWNREKQRAKTTVAGKKAERICNRGEGEKRK